MKERLDKFIKTEGLTPSRFAEIMSVQPSSVSHIIGGRNKPSFDFIEKMLLRFPKVNPDWLLMGKGPMYRTPDTSSASASAEGAINSNQNAGEGYRTETELKTQPQSSLFASTDPAATTSHLGETEKPPTQASVLNSIDPIEYLQHREPSEPAKQLPPVAKVIQKNIASKNGSDEVERVIILLKDKTFVAYEPQ